MLKQIPALMVGIGMVAAACKKQRVSDPTGAPKPAPNAEDPILDAGSTHPDSETSTVTDSGTDTFTDRNVETLLPAKASASCITTIAKLDFAQIADGPQELTPTTRLYGSTQSSLLAIGFPQYQDSGLTELYVAYADGTLIAQKKVQDVYDIQNGILRIQIFDHLQLDSKKVIAILCKVDTIFYKFVQTAPPIFETLYKGKVVFSPNDIGAGIPHASEGARPQVLVQPGQNAKLAAKQAEDYFLVADNATFQASVALQGWTLCDLMGNTVAEYAELFQDFYNQPYLIAYKLVNNQYYLRTILHLT